MLVLYLCVLIVFSLHRESLKLILVDEPPPQGGFVTLASFNNHHYLKDQYPWAQSQKVSDGPIIEVWENI
jgi:hypothetical protein